MTDQTVNVPLLRKAVEWAEAEAAKPPDVREWDQEFWILPTSMEDPYAAPGAPFADNDELTKFRARQGVAESCGTRFCIAGWIVHAAGEPVHYSDAATRAAELLNVDEMKTAALFSSENTIADVRRFAEDLAGERL